MNDYATSNMKNYITFIILLVSHEYLKFTKKLKSEKHIKQTCFKQNISTELNAELTEIILIDTKKEQKFSKNNLYY